MGMFDTVTLQCEKCHALIEIQSKSGLCELREYKIHDVPLSILAELVERSYPLTCIECGSKYKVIVQYIVTVESYR